MQQLLISIKGDVLGSEQFNVLWARGITQPQPEWLDKVAERNSISVHVSEEIMQAVRDFVNAKNWDATRHVVEKRRELLFQPEVETLFEQNITQARSAGEERAVAILEQHLTLLRQCKATSIAAAFEQLEQAQEEDELPFDAELIPRSIAALLGDPEQKMAHAQYLIEQTSKATDERLKALLQTIQLALFGRDLSQLGRDLQGNLPAMSPRKWRQVQRSLLRNVG